MEVFHVGITSILFLQPKSVLNLKLFRCKKNKENSAAAVSLHWKTEEEQSKQGSVMQNSLKKSGCLLSLQ